MTDLNNRVLHHRWHRALEGVGDGKPSDFSTLAVRLDKDLLAATGVRADRGDVEAVILGEKARSLPWDANEGRHVVQDEAQWPRVSTKVRDVAVLGRIAVPLVQERIHHEVARHGAGQIELAAARMRTEQQRDLERASGAQKGGAPR